MAIYNPIQYPNYFRPDFTPVIAKSRYDNSTSNPSATDSITVQANGSLWVTWKLTNINYFTPNLVPMTNTTHSLGSSDSNESRTYTTAHLNINAFTSGLVAPSYPSDREKNRYYITDIQYFTNYQGIENGWSLGSSHSYNGVKVSQEYIAPNYATNTASWYKIYTAKWNGSTWTDSNYSGYYIWMKNAAPAGGGGSGCLVGGDHELMVRPNKFKKIKNLKEGDMVYTSKENNSDWGEYKIDNYIETEIDSYLVVKFEDGSEIKCTDTHQFMSEGIKKGINELTIGDTVMKIAESLDGFTHIKITDIELVEKPEVCYEIDVLEADTYITENYIFQHNRKAEL